MKTTDGTTEDIIWFFYDSEGNRVGLCADYGGGIAVRAGVKYSDEAIAAGAKTLNRVDNGADAGKSIAKVYTKKKLQQPE